MCGVIENESGLEGVIMSKLAQRAQKLFIQHLRENNLKVTQERLALLDEIFATSDHLDADDLLARMKVKKRKVSRATVYRRHHHMVCMATGKIIEFWDAELDERLRHICHDHKFRPSFISIQIQGLSQEGQKVEQETSFF